MDLLTLRELCESLNLTRRTIQCYEQAGLMRPIDRNKYGHLLYDKSCVERARRIKYLQKLGFKLKDIVVLIDAPEEVFREAIEIKLEELKNKIECLEELEEETEKLLKSIQS